MASIVCSGVVLLATFFLLPWLYYLPKCVLAAMYVFLLALRYILPNDSNFVHSIGLVVFSLLAETPHDVLYYWRWVPSSLLLQI